MAGFPHSEILESTSCYRLPEAYRRFTRPSSASCAKASTVRPKQLSHTQIITDTLNNRRYTTPSNHQQNQQSPDTTYQNKIDARVHYIVLKQQPTPPPTPHTWHRQQPGKPKTTTPTHTSNSQPTTSEGQKLIASKPNSMLHPPHSPHHQPHKPAA